MASAVLVARRSVLGLRSRALLGSPWSLTIPFGCLVLGLLVGLKANTLGEVNSKDFAQEPVLAGSEAEEAPFAGVVVGEPLFRYRGPQQFKDRLCLIREFTHVHRSPHPPQALKPSLLMLSNSPHGF